MNEVYTRKVKELIDEISEKEKVNIKKAAKIIFDSFKNNGILHVFATGHSHMMAEEMFYRAGGLVQINPILRPFLMQHEGAVSSTKYERLSGISQIVYDGLDLKENDSFMIVSNSGINSVPIEMADIVTNKKHPLIVVTSVESSKKSKSRVANKKHLYEYGDVVIDNHVPLGDAVIETKYGNTGAVSSIACSFIAQLLVVEIVDLFIENGMEPPIYRSANTDGGDEHNKKIYEEYKKRVKSLY